MTNSASKANEPRPAAGWAQAVSVLVIGLGIGWLTGLSASPVVSGVITSLLGIAAGIVAGLRAVKDRESRNTDSPERSVDARPAALLVLGIAVAAPCGILARTYHVFEPPRTSDMVAVDSEQDATTVSGNSTTDSYHAGVLFAAFEQDCDRLSGMAFVGNRAAFISALEKSSLPDARQLATRFSDDYESLQLIVDVVCRSYTPASESASP